MTVLKFEGKLGCTYWGEYITIGGRDVVEEVNGTEFEGPVTATFIKGNLSVMAKDPGSDIYFMEGMQGFSEWTPAEPPDLYVGGHDFADEFAQYDGEDVTFILADEPVDLGELGFNE